ncbi:MAG: hypothetical protein EOP07_15965 [Proteobacteria bacterium]|nr:MAG: hypothetical protein EOP07_15965 [Pseudomonadota bacterium]
MGQSRKRKSLLSSQKPKKRWSFSFLSSKRFIITGLATLGLGGAIYASYNYLSKTALFAFDERPRLEALRGLTEQEQAAILARYHDLSKVRPEELAQFSKGLYRQMGLRSIQLIQTAPDRIAIATETFTPKLVAELDKLRYVTDDGIVFGGMTSTETTTLPVLRGFYKAAPFTKSENDTIVLSPANQRIVDEALLAIQEASRYNIQYRSLTFDEFRGLSAEMLEPNYRITLGFRPFEGKYLRLEKIIETLKDRGLSSATIELDYKGKAIVKETVL